MGRRVDILIIGGGIYGVATAYEAVRRGLSVVLVERGDFGGGSSSNSLKILHGGLRYLQSLDLGRSLESIRARRELLRLAPGLTRPLPCRMDTSGRPPTFSLALEVGLRLNDLISADRNREVADTHHLPGSGGGRWHDAIATDTERLLLGLLQTAVEGGDGRCQAHNYTVVNRLFRHGGQVIGAEIAGVGEVDVECVVRCVGAYRSDRPYLLSMNLLVDELPMSAAGEAVAIRHPIDGRSVFIVPWRGRSMIGTWDRPYPFDPMAPLRVEDGWVDEFLGWAAPVHPELRDLRRPDVRFVHAGLQPAETTGSVVPRRHFEITTDDDGVMNVLGVKYTTALPVARAAVARVMARLDRPPRQGGSPLPLVDHDERLARYLAELPERATPIRSGHPLTRGAVEYAVAREQARTLSDVLLRRTGVAAAGYPGHALVRAVAEVMQPLRGWSDADRDEEVAALAADFHFAGNLSEPSERPAAPGERRT